MTQINKHSSIQKNFRHWRKVFIFHERVAMFNALILSDIHIGVYRNYNQDDFRIRQFIKLKKVIIDSIQENDVKEVWIAGDLLLTAQSTPQVMSVVKDFLKTISENAIIRIVLGNHDVVVRTDKTDISEYNNYTLISLLDGIDNIKIYNDDVIMINGRRVYFHSWTPSHFNRKDADYLVCHGDSHKSLSPFSETFIDCTGYKKVFCGHIHIFKEIGNIISLGTPLMHSFSDSPDVGFIVYDLDSDTYKRISTTGMFLEFKYAETEEKAKELEQKAVENNQDAVIRVKEVKLDESIKNVSITDLAIDPKNVLKQFTENLNEKSINIINEIVADSSIQSEVPDLRVDFGKLSCKNFLSIKSLEFDFKDYTGITTIKGNIGSGKSTLFNFIEFMFFGKLSGYNKSDYQSVFADKFEGSIEFTYKKSLYVIKRTLSSLQYSKDGKYIESNRKADLQKDLEEELGFLKFWNLIYIKQSSTGIFSDMSDTSRVSFLSNLIGLNTIKLWTEKLSSYIKDKETSIQKDNDESIRLSTLISSLKSYNELNKEHNEYIDIDGLTSKISSYNNELKNLNAEKTNNFSDIMKLNNDKQMNESKIRSAYTIVENVNSDISKIKELEKLNSSLLENDLTDLELPDITTVRRNIASIDEKLLSLTSKLNLCKEKLRLLSNHPNQCPTCKQAWHIDDLDNKIKILNDGIANITSSINDLKTEKDNENIKMFQYNDIVSENAKKQGMRISINNNNALIKDKKSQIEKQIESILDIVDTTMIDEYIKIVSVNLPDTKEINNQIEKLKNDNTDIDIKIQNINQEISNINQKIGIAKVNNEIYSNIVSNVCKISESTEKLNNILSVISLENQIISELTKFNTKVLSDKGLLVASLLQKVSEYLNTDELLKVETVQELQNGSLRPTLNIKLFVKEYSKYVDYCMLSGGQRLQADLRFLKGITNSLGSVSMLLMDETFKYFSTDAVYTGIDIINDMKVDKVFLILHGMDNDKISENTIQVTLTEGGSQYVRIS